MAKNTSVLCVEDGTSGIPLSCQILLTLFCPLLGGSGPQDMYPLFCIQIKKQKKQKKQNRLLHGENKCCNYYISLLQVLTIKKNAQ